MVEEHGVAVRVYLDLLGSVENYRVSKARRERPRRVSYSTHR
jgi:hypothetical protein